MNVADLNLARNPSSASSQAASAQVLDDLDQIVDGLKREVRAAAQRGDSFDQTERTVRELTIQLGKHALELFIRLQGDGDLEQVTTDTGGGTGILFAGTLNDHLDIHFFHLRPYFPVDYGTAEAV